MRIRAAVQARDTIPGNSDLVIIGRTDSGQVFGFDEAILRLKLAAEAGADVCFIEGVKTEGQLRRTVEALAPKPVLVNVISGGLTPSFTYQEAEAIGAKIISRHSSFFFGFYGHRNSNRCTQFFRSCPVLRWSMRFARQCTL